MNCSLQRHTEINQDFINAAVLNDLKEDWKNYLTFSNTLSRSDLNRLALTEMMYLKSLQENRTLFHVSLTYKPFEDRIYRESDVNQFFTRFYLQHLLPYLLHTRRIQKHRDLQPICLAFVDEHEMTPVFVNDAVLFPERLHHHAILAVHADHVELMQDLVGTNTLNTGFSHKIMTSDVKECDAKRLLYASKMLQKYPDFLSFPDRMTSSH